MLNIKNPHTKEREQLKNLISMRGEVEFMSKTFEQAERHTDVEIAVVYLKNKLMKMSLIYLVTLKTMY